MRRAPCIALAAGLALTALGACSPDAPTAIVVGVSTQMRVPRAVRTVRVAALGGSGARACETRRLADAAQLPFVVEARGAPGEALTVTVAAWAEDASALPADPCALDGGPAPLVVRRAKTRFVGKERLYLGMPLRQSCAGVSCGADQTCLAGECAPADVAPDALVAYSDALVFGDTSFCLPVSDCFGDTAPAVPVDPRDCTYQLPDEDHHPERLNVAILHADFSREVLDLDPVEGFTRVADPARADRFRLAPALCRRAQARAIAAVYTGADCPTKGPLNPLCRAPAADAGVESALCTAPVDVPPARAAVYALVDRSRAMREHFGPTGLESALSLALRAPLLRTTQVALRLLPAASDDCASTPSAFASFAGPDAVPFTAAPDAAGPISALLGDASRVLADDPPVFLDAALRPDGVYAALAAVGAAQAIARRYALVLGNRDFQPHCGFARGGPADLAFDASVQRDMHTATMLLSAPPDTDQKGHDPFVDAVAIARASAAPFADASFGDDAIRAAVASFVAELGGCLYDLPKEIDASGDLSRVKLSFFDPVASARKELDFDAACGPTTGNGWSVDRGRVRVCGDACIAIRVPIHDAAVYTLARGFVPPDVPVRWSPPCAP